MGQPTENTAHLSQSITLIGAISLVVGGVIGAGIYVLVGTIAAKSGNALWLAFVIAMLTSLIGVLPLIQLAAALPRAGGGYTYASRMLGPFVGMVVSYWVLLGGCASTALVALTLSKSLAPVLPFVLDDHIFGLIIFLIFFGIYQFGVSLAMSLQVIMAGQLIVALLIYVVAGLLHTTPVVGWTPPLGVGPFIEAVVLCYTTCMGFQVVAELGEEIQNARRNIPLALFIGGAIVAAIYIGIGFVFISTLGHDPEGYKALAVPLTDSSRLFLPSWSIWFIALGAVTAGLTSLNAGAIALPRELFAQARDGMVPHWFGNVSPRTHTPQHAVNAFSLLVAILLLSWQDSDFYSLVAGIGILIMSAVLCVASLRLPKRYPQRYAEAYLRLPVWVLWICTIFTVFVSIGLVVLLVLQRPSVIVVYLLWSALVVVYYRLWTRRFTPEDWARCQEVEEPTAQELG